MHTQLTKRDSRLLFWALGANGIFSLACGLAMSLGHGPVASWLGVANAYWILGLGVMLMGFGGSLLLHYRRQRVSRAEAVAISVMDLAWVIASALLVLLAPQWFISGGLIAVIVVGVIVLGFFELQVVGLWRARRSVP